MISAPDLVHYVCIARGTTVLAEFNSKDEKLGSIAGKCLEKTPSFHSIFTHTVRSQTYTFLIDDPLIYFAIFDEKLEKCEGLGFLKSAKQTFDKFFQGDLGKKRLDRVSAHCFQGEFNPVFHRLLGPGPESEPAVPICERFDQSDSLYSGSGHLGGPNGDSSMNLKKKKKNRMFVNFKIGSGDMKGRGGIEKKVDVGAEDDDRDGILLSREFSAVMHKNEMYSCQLMGNHNHQKAKKVWKKQAWIVLSLDFYLAVLPWLFASVLLVSNAKLFLYRGVIEIMNSNLMLRRMNESAAFLFVRNDEILNGYDGITA
ncbi:phytolongin Phyl2.2-like [Olea europaea var. sylvestris]|uniref:phytolongin Phyl2.2-like n=1 Tax=Olea europaea var. sylvestris TaxID=158386 RepID=UPI000C1CCD36|nr:phytolongin Phyl2.2-like [Olea europaea var. sylvestris]